MRRVLGCVVDRLSVFAQKEASRVEPALDLRRRGESLGKYCWRELRRSVWWVQDFAP